MIRFLSSLALVSMISSPAFADQRFSGFVLAGGGYRVTPQVSSITYLRSDSVNHGISWTENTFDRDVLSPKPGWSAYQGLNYSNSHFSAYGGGAFEKPLVGKADFMTKAGANIKLGPLAALYLGPQVRLDYDCRRVVGSNATRCAIRPDVRYDLKF